MIGQLLPPTFSVCTQTHSISIKNYEVPKKTLVDSIL